MRKYVLVAGKVVAGSLPPAWRRPKPSSEKDGESGHTPVSIMPTMTSTSVGRLRLWKPRKSHDLVVWSWYVRLWKTDTISSVLDSFCFSSSVSLAANPLMLLV